MLFIKKVTYLPCTERVALIVFHRCVEMHCDIFGVFAAGLANQGMGSSQVKSIYFNLPSQGN